MPPEDNARIHDVWTRIISCADGPLPGAQLNAVATPHGWCGQVSEVAAKEAVAAGPAIATAYDLPPSSVIVQQTGDDTAFIWSYRHPSGADYHRQWPPAVIDGSEYVDVQRVSSGPSLLDFVRLTEMAHKHRTSWNDLRTGRPVDIRRFVRRMAMLRAGILDILASTRPAPVTELLQRVGVPAESLPTDLLLALGYPVTTMPTLPRRLGVKFPDPDPATERM
jgi:hypothetical protein